MKIADMPRLLSLLSGLKTRNLTPEQRLHFIKTLGQLRKADKDRIEAIRDAMTNLSIRMTPDGAVDREKTDPEDLSSFSRTVEELNRGEISVERFLPGDALDALITENDLTLGDAEALSEFLSNDTAADPAGKTSMLQ